MTDPYLADRDFVLYQGDAREVLAGLEPESVQMCVTSPPFFGLRDYGTGQWEGGDAGCDHRKRPPRSPRTRVDGFNGSASTAPLEDRLYGATCGRCGARRVDRQIGLEATP